MNDDTTWPSSTYVLAAFLMLGLAIMNLINHRLGWTLADAGTAFACLGFAWANLPPKNQDTPSEEE